MPVGHVTILMMHLQKNYAKTIMLHPWDNVGYNAYRSFCPQYFEIHQFSKGQSLVLRWINSTSDFENTIGFIFSHTQHLLQYACEAINDKVPGYQQWLKYFHPDR